MRPLKWVSSSLTTEERVIVEYMSSHNCHFTVWRFAISVCVERIITWNVTLFLSNKKLILFKNMHKNIYKLKKINQNATWN
jgi:hypothetical protein